MKLRKNIVISLITVMTLYLTACGNPQAQNVSGQEVTNGTEMQAETSVEQESTDYGEVVTGSSDIEISETETFEMEKDEADESHSSDVPAFEEDVSQEDLKTNAKLEETVLVEENDIKITITGMEYTGNGIELKLMLENNSDKDLSFLSGTGSYSCNAINGYMMDGGYLNVKIPAGKKANETVCFRGDELSLYGITEIADIQLGFTLRDENYADVYIGPRQVRTDAADSYDYETDTYFQTMSNGIWEKLYKCTIDYWAEEELYNQDSVRIISEALMTNQDGEKIVLIEVQNDSDEQIDVITSDIMVNGLMICDFTWSGDYINPKTRRVIALPLFSMLDEPYWEVFDLLDIGDFTFSITLCSFDDEVISESQEINMVISKEVMAPDDTGTELYNENRIRIISKGLYEDTFLYSDDIHILFLVENLSNEAIYIDDSYESLSVNGFITDCYSRRCKVPSGKYTFIDMEMQASSLEDNGITDIEDIAEVDMVFEIRNEDYKRLAEPRVTMTY